ncbi:MAG: phosphate acyltransferase PlsX [Rhizobiales bacterium]|nr:phosphate acyltransferase PlsX [Hyphomicrobiales bacterium]NRB12811.1 phosphate acyltransferase PlsX [Hyphomicrobiales bacterium]
MTEKIVIALDVMSGESGAEASLSGANISLERNGNLYFHLFGDQATIEQHLTKLPKLSANSQIQHSDFVVPMDMKPRQALRKGRKVSSMWQAINSVQENHAGGAVSAGNTGALMAMATICLRTLRRIDRTAIAAIWPTRIGETIVLDMGANLHVSAENLIDFGFMGAAMSRVIFGIKTPKVGILNIGEEEIKGNEDLKTAATIFREAKMPLEYIGFVEGDGISKGLADVVVTEGFAGNIALKTAEGTARQISQLLKDAFNSNWRSKLAYLLLAPSLKIMRQKMDPNNSNGGVFLGLRGIVVKCHGSSNALGFAHAIDLTARMIKNDLVNEIRKDLDIFYKDPMSEEIKATSISSEVGK